MREIASIMSIEGGVLSTTFGNTSSVDFDLLKMWEVHKKDPQSWYLLHTHPDGCTEFSQDDKEVYEGVACMMYPYPIYGAVIARDEEGNRSIKCNRYILVKLEDEAPFVHVEKIDYGGVYTSFYFPFQIPFIQKLARML